MWFYNSQKMLLTCLMVAFGVFVNGDHFSSKLIKFDLIWIDFVYCLFLISRLVYSQAKADPIICAGRIKEIRFSTGTTVDKTLTHFTLIRLEDQGHFSAREWSTQNQHLRKVLMRAYNLNISIQVSSPDCDRGDYYFESFAVDLNMLPKL